VVLLSLSLTIPGVGPTHSVSAKEPPADPLPDGAIARLGSSCFRHEADVRTLAFCPGGKMLATSSWGTGISLWDSGTGKRLFSLSKRGCGRSLAFSPDGKLLVTSDPFAVWDVREARLIRRFQAQDQFDDPAALFSPDGVTVAAWKWNTPVSLWDVRTGRQTRRLPHTSSVRCAAFSPDGTLLAAGGEGGTIVVWEVESGSRVAQYKGTSAEEVRAVAFSPDGRAIASTDGDNKVRLWDPLTGTLRTTLDTTGRVIACLTFAPDGKSLAVGHHGATICLHDPATGKETRRWRTGDGPELTIAFSPDGKTLASANGSDRVPQLWDTGTGRDLFPVVGHAGPVHGLAFAQDGESLVSCGWDRLVQWDLRSGTPRRSFAPPDSGSPRSLRLSPDGKRLAYTLLDAGHRNLYLWEPGTGGEPRRLSQDIKLGVEISLVEELVFSPGPGRWLALSRSEGDRVWLWDTASGHEMAALPVGKPNNAHHMALSPDGQRLATIDNHGSDAAWGVRLWDVKSGGEHQQLMLDTQPYGVAFTPSGETLIVVGSKGQLLWDVQMGKARRLPARTKFSSPIAFSGDGLLMACGDETTVRLWETTTWREVRHFTAPDAGGIRSVAFSPDTRTLASGLGSGHVLVWDVTGRGSAPRAARRLGPERLELLWRQLDDPAEAIPFLKEHLPPPGPADERRFAKLLAELDDDEFSVRERATARLTELGRDVEPGVRRVLAGEPSAEVRKRLEVVLAGLPAVPPLRVRRAIHLLECSPAPEARDLLERLAAAWEGDCRAYQARSALTRRQR
jgi:WD40 repeat protein